jgi:hypothetical protein
MHETQLNRFTTILKLYNATKSTQYINLYTNNLLPIKYGFN